MQTTESTEPVEPTYNEFEVKFYPVDKGEIRKNLIASGAILSQEERIMRSQLFHSNKNPNMKCDYIRVRSEGNRITMSAKTHAKDGDIAGQFEVGMEISDYDAAVEMLIRAGLIAGSFHENKRETWNLGPAEVVIDTWPDLESYIEIEAPTEEDVHAAADILNCNWENRMVAQVIDIYADKYGVSREEALSRMDAATFDNPPYKDYYAETE